MLNIASAACPAKGAQPMLAGALPAVGRVQYADFPKNDELSCWEGEAPAEPAPSEAPSRRGLAVSPRPPD